MTSFWLGFIDSEWSQKHPRGLSYIVRSILPNFNRSLAGPTTTKVETCTLCPLQFSTLVELESGKWSIPVRVGCEHVSRVTARRIFPKLGMKLKYDNIRIVTRPVFP